METFHKLQAINQIIKTQIRSSYAEWHRYYHNMNHINQCLNELVRIRKEVNDTEYRLLMLAIYYHDIIFVPFSSLNEEMSASKFEYDAKILKIAESEEIEKIKDLILATKNHFEIKPEKLFFYITDIDLSILGQNEKTYTEYAFQISREYCVDNFAQLRVKFLKSILSRERIYKTQSFMHYEKQARLNIENEIKLIQK